jgi:hypothetical protein
MSSGYMILPIYTVTLKAGESIILHDPEPYAVEIHGVEYFYRA